MRKPGPGPAHVLREGLIVLWAMVVARPRLLVGAGMMSLGGLLLLAAAGYIGLDAWGRSQIDDLRVAGPEGGVDYQDLARDLIGNAGAQTLAATPGIGEESVEPPATPLPGAISAPRCGDGWEFAQLQTRAGASGAYGGSAIGAQFTVADLDAAPLSVGNLPRAERIVIPAIGVDSSIEELRIRSVGTEYAWETADHAVGHHLGTPNPGERGNAVYSGHINSPFRGEGAVFANLPDVACLLKSGQVVDIILEAGDTRYLYRAVSTDAQKPEDINVFRASEVPSLSLVTCWPRTSYNYRFVVDAVLVGTAPRAPM